MPEASKGTDESSDLVVVGRIRRSHGVHGILVVEAMTSSPDLVFTEGREFIAGTVKGQPAMPARTLRIEMVEPFMGGYRVQFSGIVGRDEADRWRNRYVLAPREGLPEPGEDEIYLYDLVGLSVQGKAGEAIGSVQAYYELPHDVMIEVDRPGGSVLIPYRFVTHVDLEAKRLVVDPPEGLL